MYVDDYERIREYVSVSPLNIQHNITKPEKNSIEERVPWVAIRKEVLDHRMRDFCVCDRMPNQNLCGLQNIEC